jgi:hypothetical protein
MCLNKLLGSEEEIKDIQINHPILVPAVEDAVIDPPPPIANPINQNAEINIEPEINIIEGNIYKLDFKIILLF